MWPSLNAYPGTCDTAPGMAIPSERIEKAIARDMGWERLIPVNGFRTMLGMEDVLAVEREVPRLMRVKKLALTEDDFSSVMTSPDKKLTPAVEWYWRIANLLQVAYPMVRLSEPVQAVYELAREKGYLDGGGSLLPKAEIWQRRTPQGIQQALEFLQALKCHYSSRAYQEALRHREEQAAHNRERQLLLLDYLLVKHERLRVIGIDLFLDKENAPAGVRPGYYVKNVIQCRKRLFNNFRLSRTFREGVHGYLWHLSFSRERGYYVRVFFFVVIGDMGWSEKFISRVSRAWSDVTGYFGLCEDLRKCQNDIARANGVVDAKNENSIKKIQTAILYQIEKDRRFRVMAPGRLHVFGHSEMKDLSQAMLGRSWLKTLSQSSGESPQSNGSQESRLQRLHSEVMKRESQKAVGHHDGGPSVRGNIDVV